MTTRDTSRSAYNDLVQRGLLVGKQSLILDALIEIGTATSGEILRSLDDGGTHINNVNAWRARFTELQGRGLIREAGARRCRVTNRTCITWMATGRTKPLDVKKGARNHDKVAAWRSLADRMAGVIGGVSHEDKQAVIDDYRKMVGGPRRRAA